MKSYSVSINGKKFEVTVEETTLDNQVATPVAPVKNEAEIKSASPVPVKTPVGDGIKVTAPMPGTVLSVKVSEGSSVKVGQAVVVLEAMKMENEIAATADGVVHICVNCGDKVNTGDILATIIGGNK